MPVEPDKVRAIEERAFNAWPALQTLVCDGWLLRFAEGYTKRANSINAWQPAAPIDAILAHAAPIYSARGLPLIARLSPLAGPETDAALAARGFADADETIVMTAPLEAAARAAMPTGLSITTTPGEAWLEGFAAANQVPAGRRAVHDRMLRLIAPPAAFACLAVAERPIAWGLGVAERGMAGFFDIVTAPDARRQGAAARLMAGLLGWAARQGAATAYLQVVARNAPAIALYAGLGFAEAYRYHYRIGPANT